MGPVSRENAGLSAAAASVRTVCAQLGLDGRRVELLRGHSNVVFRLVHEPVVARVGPSLATLHRAQNATRVTRWLTGLGFPTVEPLGGVRQPHVVGQHVVTLWRYLPQPPDRRPPVPVLGRLLRQLHGLPEPPFPLPRNEPLGRLREAMAGTDVLTPEQASFLSRRIEQLATAYGRLHFVLPPGTIHGDAHKGNLLFDAQRPPDDQVVLCDWDSVSVGAREWDLVPTHHGQRFGVSDADRAAFSAAYGYDLREWPGSEVVRDLRDLFTIGAYIRNARDNPAARQEMEHRITSLVEGDRTRRWYPL
jgi:aminoglycoside phosphotransferase (APT) family kinase protein